MLKKECGMEGEIRIPFEIEGKEYRIDIHFDRNEITINELTERTEHSECHKGIKRMKIWGK